jgi:ribosomal protein RSM22 (predicted rRNA methylase)
MTPFQCRSLSPLVLRALEESGAATAGAQPRQTAESVAELSRLFTKERTSLGHDYLNDPALAAAYLHYFLPVNLSKLQALFEELPEDTWKATGDARFNVLDLGAGPGTGGLAILDWLHRCGHQSANLSVVAIDASTSAIRQAERLWRTYSRLAKTNGPTLETCEADLTPAFDGILSERLRRTAHYDLIILANCLNELFTNSPDPVEGRAKLMFELLPLLKPSGTLMLLEPALRQTSRELHLLRDRLLQEKRCTVYSPCLHEGNCPALINPDDWCHEERRWEPPASIQEIDREVGFIKDALKFSYLLLRTDGRTIAERSQQTFRMVSELRKLKGDTRAWLCNELGRSEVGRLDRVKSEANSAWDDCRRGTIVRIEGITRKEGSSLSRIPEEGTVEIVRPI